MNHESTNVKDTITVVKVSNLPKSRRWYSKLLGKQPDLEPFPGNVEYKIGGTWLQISEGKVLPSSWSLQVEVENLPRERERMINSGVKIPKIETVPGVISWFDVKDPDGNSMRWFQVLTTNSKVVGKRSQ